MRRQAGSSEHRLTFPSFPPVFHEWFVEMFPEPGTWFTARLKYTRSCAVMSMVGMVLGSVEAHTGTLDKD